MYCTQRHGLVSLDTQDEQTLTWPGKTIGDDQMKCVRTKKTWMGVFFSHTVMGDLKQFG